jgi:hypothetical protein
VITFCLACFYSTPTYTSLAAKLSGDSYGTLALQKANDFRDFHLWWYLNEHVHMIWFEIAFQNFTLLLDCQGMKDLTETGTNVPVQSVLSHLWDEDDMIFAVPLRMSETVIDL